MALVKRVEFVERADLGSDLFLVWDGLFGEHRHFVALLGTSVPRTVRGCYRWRRPSREATSRVRPIHFPSDHSSRPRIRPATTVPIVLRAAMTRSSGRSSRPTVRTPRSTRSPF
ncbi:unnamed protein product [Microthlaspi erraticum]|uniref:Uncharacterized protein n=1 Tax=Microthlaspi erraticum TaxID=1685480 RepID=A0A6D2L029_9BRAS|nr:unnamed protein product [Microthlaspi erraticum]